MIWGSKYQRGPRYSSMRRTRSEGIENLGLVVCGGLGHDRLAGLAPGVERTHLESCRSADCAQMRVW